MRGVRALAIPSFSFHRLALQNVWPVSLQGHLWPSSPETVQVWRCLIGMRMRVPPVKRTAAASVWKVSLQTFVETLDDSCWTVLFVFSKRSVRSFLCNFVTKYVFAFVMWTEVLTTELFQVQKYYMGKTWNELYSIKCVLRFCMYIYRLLTQPVTDWSTSGAF